MSESRGKKASTKDNALAMEVEILTKDHEIRGLIYVARDIDESRRISELLNAAAGLVDKAGQEVERDFDDAAQGVETPAAAQHDQPDAKRQEQAEERQPNACASTAHSGRIRKGKPRSLGGR